MCSVDLGACKALVTWRLLALEAAPYSLIAALYAVCNLRTVVQAMQQHSIQGRVCRVCPVNTIAFALGYWVLNLWAQYV